MENRVSLFKSLESRVTCISMYDGVFESKQGSVQQENSF